MDFFSVGYIESRSTKEPNSGCWLWLGQVSNRGYGIFRTSKRSKWNFAHRVAYMAAHGSVAPGLDVAHVCHVRSCVNPQHLVAATRSENMTHPGSPLDLKIKRAVDVSKLVVVNNKRGRSICAIAKSVGIGRALLTRVVKNAVQ